MYPDRTVFLHQGLAVYVATWSPACVSHPGTQSCGFQRLRRALGIRGMKGTRAHSLTSDRIQQAKITYRRGRACQGRSLSWGEKPELEAEGGVEGGVKRAHPETFPGTRTGVPRPRAACNQDPMASVTGRSAGHLAGRWGTESGPTQGRAGTDSSPVAMVSLRCDTGAGPGMLRQTWPSGPAAGP